MIGSFYRFYLLSIAFLQTLRQCACMRIVRFTVSILLLVGSAFAGPKLATTQAFDRYVALTEAQIQSELISGQFLSIDLLPAQERADASDRLKRGEIIIRRLTTEDSGHKIEVPDGLIHHWLATAFVPGATLEQTLALVQDYDHQHQFYSPDVQHSRLISRHGDDFHVFLRFRRSKVVTVVLDTEHDVHYTRVDPSHAYSRSVSTRISEVADPGKPSEHEFGLGEDHGFLWRLNSYWRFEEADGGVFIECEAVSLTRDIPTGLGWLVGPFVESVPRESLLFTMTATRKALGKPSQQFSVDSSQCKTETRQLATVNCELKTVNSH